MNSKKTNFKLVINFFNPKKILLLFFLISFCVNSFSQQPIINTNHSPNGVFDVVFDKDGRSYELKDLIIDEARTTLLCTPGYFNVYFEIGSGMEGTSAAEVARRNVICQVLNDISTFIPAPPGTPLAAGTLRVNILVDDISSDFAFQRLAQAEFWV